MAALDLDMLGERSRPGFSRRNCVRSLIVFSLDGLEHDLADMEKDSASGSVKITLFDCCLCLTTTADRYYLLEGDRAGDKNTKVKFRDKIKDLTGIDIKSVISTPDEPRQTGVDISAFGRVCKSCTNRLVNYSAFKTESLKNLHTIAQRQSIVKRCNTSPQSPKLPLPLPNIDNEQPPTGDDSGFLESDPECPTPSSLQTSTPQPSRKKNPNSSSTQAAGKTRLKVKKKQKVAEIVNMPCLSSNPTASTSQGPTPTIGTETSLQACVITGSDHSYVKRPLQAECEDNSNSVYDKLKLRGIQWDSKYRCSPQDKIPSDSKSDLLGAVLTGTVDGIVSKFCENPALLLALKRKLLLDLDADISGLLSRSVPSVLLRQPVESLDNVTKMLMDIFNEMDSRCSFLLDILVTTMNAPLVQPKTAMLTPLACVYSILMSRRDMNLSGFQRLNTLLAVKGGANDQFITQLNHMGITLSTTSKRNLLDECVYSFDKRIVERLKTNTAVKVTGDNMDMYVRTSNPSSTNGNRDLHMFASNLIFSRVPHDHLSNVPPPTVEHVPVERVLVTEVERARLITAYAVLVGRLLCNSLTQFAWLEEVLPKHIPHGNEIYMSTKSEVFPLPILESNESRYEECFDILDSYQQQVVNVFTKAHGSTDILDEKRVIIGGDQLTRVRLDGACNLRNLAPEPILQYVHLQPVVCEMWHVKQDLLHKAYAALFDKASHTEKGTLFFFKVELGQKSVNGNVKSNFKAHWNHLITVGSQCIVEQAMDYFGMETAQSEPTNHRPPADIAAMGNIEKGELAMEMLRKFVVHNGYAAFSLDEAPAMPPPPPPKKRLQLQRLQDGTAVFRWVLDAPPPPPPPAPVPLPADHLQNYAHSLCKWTLHLLELDDTAKEGDAERLLLNCKYNLPLFFSHSARSHYYRENLDFLLKATELCSPQMRSRILEGAFINKKGGKGNNVEADLVQEHSVRNRKDLVRGLGANKTSKAIERVTTAADHVEAVNHAFNKAASIPASSGRHSKTVSEADMKKVHDVYRKLRPFKSKPGRDCKGFTGIKSDPTLDIDKAKFRLSLERNIKRTITGAPIDGEPEAAGEDVQNNIDDEGENDYEVII